MRRHALALVALAFLAPAAQAQTLPVAVVQPTLDLAVVPPTGPVPAEGVTVAYKATYTVDAPAVGTVEVSLFLDDPTGELPWTVAFDPPTHTFQLAPAASQSFTVEGIARLTPQARAEGLDADMLPLAAWATGDELRGWGHGMADVRVMAAWEPGLHVRVPGRPLILLEEDGGFASSSIGVHNTGNALVGTRAVITSSPEGCDAAVGPGVTLPRDEWGAIELRVTCEKGYAPGPLVVAYHHAPQAPTDLTADPVIVTFSVAPPGSVEETGDGMVLWTDYGTAKTPMGGAFLVALAFALVAVVARRSVRP